MDQTPFDAMLNELFESERIFEEITSNETKELLELQSLLRLDMSKEDQDKVYSQIRRRSKDLLELHLSRFRGELSPKSESFVFRKYKKDLKLNGTGRLIMHK